MTFVAETAETVGRTGRRTLTKSVIAPKASAAILLNLSPIAETNKGTNLGNSSEKALR